MRVEETNGHSIVPPAGPVLKFGDPLGRFTLGRNAERLGAFLLPVGQALHRACDDASSAPSYDVTPTPCFIAPVLPRIVSAKTSSCVMRNAGGSSSSQPSHVRLTSEPGAVRLAEWIPFSGSRLLSDNLRPFSYVVRFAS